MHIHTKYSFNSLFETKTIVKFASKRGLSTVAITKSQYNKGRFDCRKGSIGN
jgi:predicted metal-dependent phosphoesterase TrpH